MTRISRLKNPPKSLMLNENGSRTRHSIMKFWKTKDKETILRTLFFMRLIQRMGFFRKRRNQEKGSHRIQEQGIQPRKKEKGISTMMPKRIPRARALQQPKE